MKYANQPAAATLAVRTNANANCVIEFCQSSLDFEKQPPHCHRLCGMNLDLSGLQARVQSLHHMDYQIGMDFESSARNEPIPLC